MIEIKKEDAIRVRKELKRFQAKEVYVRYYFSKDVTGNRLEFQGYNLHGDRCQIDIAFTNTVPYSSPTKIVIESLDLKDVVLDYILSPSYYINCTSHNIDGLRFEGNDTVYWEDLIVFVTKNKICHKTQFCWNNAMMIYK